MSRKKPQALCASFDGITAGWFFSRVPPVCGVPAGLCAQCCVLVRSGPLQAGLSFSLP